MKPLDRSNAPHYVWGDVCEGWHLLKNEALSVIEERVPPGASEVPHFHTVAQQCFYILEGEAVMVLEGAEVPLHTGQSLAVPAGAVHQFLNRSTEDVRMLVISQPPAQGDRQLV